MIDRIGYDLLNRFFCGISVWLPVVVLFLSSPLAIGQTIPDAVKDIFQQRCLSCHNDLDQEGEFSLQSKASLQNSGYVQAGEPQDSHLLAVITGDESQPPSMPKNGPPLTDQEIQAIKAWIKDGSPWPNDLILHEPAVEDYDWWSLRPIRRPDVPQFDDKYARQWQSTPVDAFVLRKLRRHELHPSGKADRRTLIRRLTYDLTGLPPTPDEIEDFVSSHDSEAYESLVERLLSSPRYGERWARHWLDVVKYADTCGYDKDKLRPNAWPYRDYVIRSFNQDKPYSRFVKEQIAGDVLYSGDPEGILGLGFIAAGPWDFIGHVEVPESKIDGMVARNLDRDDMVTNVMNTFCSVTIQCARCHNHKFDPFTQEHYYSLQSVFAAVDRAERPYDTSPRIEQQRSQLNNELTSIRQQLDQLDKQIRTEAGEPLVQFDKAIAELKPKSKPVGKRPEFGYHSQIAQKQNTTKWVEIDLGRTVELQQIVLHPCHDDFAGIGAGFGFPVVFHIELDNEPRQLGNSDATPTGTVLRLDEIAEDRKFPNPGLASVTVSAEGLHARYVRVVATTLAERKNDFIFALAELDVIDSKGKNVALSTPVTALDSIEAPNRWRKSNLTDGIFATAADPDAVKKLQQAERERQQILDRVNTPERRTKREQLSSRQQEVKKNLDSLPVGKMVYAAATNFKPQGNFKPTGGKPRRVRLLHRGNIQQPTDDIAPGAVPLGSESHWKFSLSDDHSEGDRRAALAEWVVADDNPLTWRSMANRVWQYHFGQGLVASPK